jgi:short-subunit dehydrogenase involved in D-alanine esterification of teichoic acids
VFIGVSACSVISPVTVVIVGGGNGVSSVHSPRIVGSHGTVIICKRRKRESTTKKVEKTTKFTIFI